MLTRTSLLALTIAVAVQALVVVTTTVGARADSTTVFSCVGAGGFFHGASNCVKIRREGPSQAGILHAQPPSPEELAEARERDRKWRAHCRPVLRQDEYGVSRYYYAARGCEFGKSEH
jgi:hypothetical protein